MGREAFSPFLAWAGMCLSVVRQSYSPARTADRILLAAYAVEHQNGLFRWLCQAGFMRLFLFSRFFFFEIRLRLWALWTQSSALGTSP